MNEGPSVPHLPRAEAVHFAFRGASEISKLLRGATHFLEIAAAAVALWSATDAELRWTTYLAVILIAVASALRATIRRIEPYAQICRRLAIRAIASEHDVDPRTHSDIMNGLWPIARAIAVRLPAATIVQYYEPTRPKGLERLREVYAETSFWTGRLLERYSKVLWLILAVATVGVFSTLYCLSVSSNHDQRTRDVVVVALCSVVIGQAIFRLIDAADSTGRDAKAALRVADRLLETPPPTAPRIAELAFEYDLALCCSAAPPTWIYKWMRGSLNTIWRDRRESLSGTSSIEC